MEHQHGENAHIHNNLLSHAKKKAKKLFTLAKNDSYNLKIENLSQAKELIAKIHGFENWHILEKVANVSFSMNADYENLDMPYILAQIESEAQIKENFLIMNSNEPGYIYSALTFRHLKISNYGDIFSLGENNRALIKEIEMSMDREFSVINLDILHTDLPAGKNNITVEKPIKLDNNINLDPRLIDILQIPALSQKNTFKEDEFGAYCVLSLKTPVIAQSEHLNLLNNLKTLLGSFCKVTDVTHNMEINEFKKVLAYQNQKISYTVCDSKNTTGKNSKFSNIMDSMITGTKYVSIFENKKLNWSVHFDTNGNHHHLLIQVYAQDKKELDEIVFLTQGYQKEIEKNSIENIVNSLNEKSLLLNYKTDVFQQMNGNLFENMTSLKTGNSRNTLVFGRPGCGKSMFLNVLNLSQCMQTKNNDLPKIRVIDIGPSSSGFFSLIKDSLSPDRQHKVGYHRIRMTEEYCVNLFDTELGARRPTPTHRAFLLNFMLLLLTDISQDKPETDMTGFVQAVLDKMYDQVSDKNAPKRYNAGIDQRVDTVLGQTGFVVDNKTTWWEVVDHLFYSHYYYEAKLAQRHAVPLLSDTPYIVADDKIRNIYSKVNVNTGETLLEYCKRLINDALSQYKILSRPTVLDVDEEDIIGIDLDEVVRTGHGQAEKQTAVMYLVALYLANKNMKYHDFSENSFLQEKENNYLDYHTQQYLQSNSNVVDKLLMFDELHRISRFSLASQQIMVELRESKKHDISITVATQSINDITEIMLPFLDNMVIMDAGNNAEQERLVKILNMTAIEKRQLKNIYGPRANTPSVFMIKNREYAELISLSIPVKLILAFSNTLEDIRLRKLLAQKIGLFNALDIIAAYYPQGIKNEVEKRKQDMSPVWYENIENREDIIQYLAEELLSYWHKYLAKK